MKKSLLALGIVFAGFSASAQYFSASSGAEFQNFSLIDADTNTWDIYDIAGTTLPMEAQGEVLMSFSFDNAAGTPLTPDNFIVTPVINLTGVTGTVAVSFKVGSPETTASGWYEEYLSVYAFDGVNGLAAAMAAPIHSQALTAGEQMFYFAYDISSFAGADSLMIAFRHHNCTDENFIVLDEINVTNALSINENVVSAAVYPNPATDVLNITATKEEVAEVTVVTMDGKVVSTTIGSAVNVADLKSGMYIYEATMVSGKVARGNFAKN